MDPKTPESPAETYQEGTTPVQIFTCRAIPVDEAALEPRRGRPQPVQPQESHSSANGEDRTAPDTAPAE